MSAFFRRVASKATEPQLLFPGLAVALTALLWLGTWVLINVERQTAERGALALARELTETYEAQVLRVLREIDQGFKLIQYARERQTPQHILGELGSRELLPPALLFNIAVFTPEGDALAGSMSLENPIDSDAIQDLRDEDQMVVAVPEAEAASQNLLQFRRRLVDDDGQFAGAAVIEVDAAFFASSYDHTRMGKQGLLALLGQNGEFLVRRVGDNISVGERVDFASYMEGVLSELETVSLLRASPVDGVSRYLAARELFGFPLAVVVGLSQDEQMAPVRARAKSYMGRAAIINLLMLMVLALLWRLSYQLTLSRRHEMQARIAHAEQVEYLAYHDGLTGLPNRSLFSKLLSQGISEAGRDQHQLAVMFLDLDHFKYINDTLGHDAGDALLQEVAARLKNALRDSDIVARLGGDEFVVILPQLADSTQSATVARKIITAVARPYRLAGQDYRVTASIGISTFPDDGRDEETLTKNADIAMYKAKQEGKNNFQLYSASLHAESLERLSLEGNLRQALPNQEFKVFYQAKRDINDGQITGVEAQLRWLHPEMGLVTPSRFLPAAEAMGLLVPIGRWMLNEVCRQHRQWQREGGESLCIAVELWGPMFFANHLVVDLLAALEASELPASFLELEVSESVLMQNIDKGLEVLEKLKKLGVRIALENFGVGYSCLSALRKLPVDAINIDRSFMHNINAQGEDRELAAAICIMGKTLGVSLVADGVETEGQMAFLKANSENGVQGFYSNLAVPPEEFSALLKNGPDQRGD